MGCFTPVRCFRDFAPAIPIPEIYWNVDSAEERILAICNAMKAIVDYAESIGADVTELQEAVEHLNQEFEEFKAHGFDEYYAEQIEQWVNDNMTGIIERTIEFVYFGLTDDGYFCAYVPDSWSDIVFDTGAVYGRSDYGRLILKMHTDGQNAIDNTYSYSLAQTLTDSERFIRDLENTTRRSDASFETLFTNLTEEVDINGSE